MSETFAPFPMVISLADTANDWQGNNVAARLFRAPAAGYGGAVTILEAYFTNGAATGAGTGFSLQLEIWPVDSATPSGTIAAYIGGTGDPFEANIPKAFTIDDGKLEAGEWLAIRKAETNSSDPTRGMLYLLLAHGA